ncbi:spore-associated protein [Streptomyces griseorubiginosus]|uniref:spore-associated protein n=1 Tax=Streptomyces griseorubiginosus TaxID=67304 RepID=UPI0036E17BE3
MNIIQRATAVGAVAAALVGAMGAVAPQAGAATPVAKYNGVCGAGYTVVDSSPVGTAGTVYLTYNPSTWKDCVVTVRARTGTAVTMLAAVTDAQDVDPEFDEGSYKTYAGPVYIGHPGHCVSYWGRISDQSGGANNVHCAPLT